MDIEWITTSEAAEISGYHPHYVRQLVREGEIEGRKFATIWQVDKASLLVYLKKMEATGKRRGPKPKTGT